jgi:hypothetical protein
MIAYLTLKRASCSLAVFVALTTTALAGVSCPDTKQGEFSVLIRSDFSDLGPFSCTHDLISSQGATFSWTNNLLTHQNTAAADGLIALDYSLYQAPGNFLQGISIGAFVQGNNTYQFQPTATQARDGYTVTPGGFVEFDLFNSLPRFGGIDAFRFRGGQAMASTGTTSDSFVAEWIPTYDTGFLLTNQAVPIGKTGLLFTFAPELMVQYDHFDGGTKTAAIFSDHNEALRIGPQFLMILNFERTYLPKNLQFLTSCSFQLTNHESWDQNSGKEYTWTAAAFNYTFPSFSNPNLPHFGLTASYGVGNSEATGNQTKQVKLGLAAKL